MKHLFIINPKAGNGKATVYEEKIKDYFNNKSDDYQIIFTKKEGHAIDIVKSYEFTEDCKVYSIGGDGTLNEVLNGLIGKNASLGIIPAGSGNDFIKSYLEKVNPDSILAKTIEGTSKAVDIGAMNNRYFINISSIGFDADVLMNSRIFKNKAILSGKIAYMLGLITTLFKIKSEKIKFIIDGKEHNENMILIAAANGRYYGGGKAIAPKAEIIDGFLDVYGIAKSSPYKIFRYIKAVLMNKDIKDIEGTYYFRCKSLKIISEKEIVSNIDGELMKDREFNFEIIPKGINLIIPKEDNGVEEKINAKL